ncbi:hypothetical protein ACFOU2_09080 [Bacillus songklensis]|uniref:Uncharacterized protein n=1 Tax=Bacillus songklensis TaxID=1069116 RepID=A0ABV8B076_9BACI
MELLTEKPLFGFVGRREMTVGYSLRNWTMKSTTRFPQQRVI